MLLTDGNPNTTEDLRVYESMILNVANTEMINLDTKLMLATQEITEDVINILLDHVVDPLTAPLTNQRRTKGASDVVVTPQLKRWHAVHTLAVVYRDAFNNQLNDRYQVKWNEYRALEAEARDAALRYGIGLVFNPIPKAGCPILSAAPGQNPETIYFAQIAWVSSTGQAGAPSDPISFDAPAGSTLVVGGATNPPTAATGFNVYAGVSPDALSLQNSAPVAISGSFTLPPSGLVAGLAPGIGQQPDTYITGGSKLRRG